MSELLIEARGLTVGYGTREALRVDEFRIAAGEIVALVGPNGSGKSTLLRSLAGIQDNAQGQVRFAEKPMESFSMQERARFAAYVGSEFNSSFPIRVRDAVALGFLCRSGPRLAMLSDQQRESLSEAMRRCGCRELQDRMLGSLSGGERQLVALARALVQGSRVLLLDESLGKMDLHHQARAGRLLLELAEEGRAAVLVSHDLQVAAEWSTHASIIRSGEIVTSGPTREVLTPAVLERVYPGARFFSLEHPEGRFPVLIPGRDQK